MGYRCPVCDDPQPDEEHLANHMAFTGLLGDESHEEWLNEVVPSWSEMAPESLGDALTEEVQAVELEDIETDDTPPPGRPDLDSQRRGTEDQAIDPETAAVIEEARELTREMHASPEGPDEDDQQEDGQDEGENG